MEMNWQLCLLKCGQEDTIFSVTYDIYAHTQKEVRHTESDRTLTVAPQPTKSLSLLDYEFHKVINDTEMDIDLSWQNMDMSSVKKDSIPEAELGNE
jgi:hypothetical protein